MAINTLLDALKIGAKIEFTGGYWMSGDAKTGYINVGTQFGDEGCWDLSETGLNDALNDLAKMAANDGYDLQGNAISQDATEDLGDESAGYPTP